MKIIHLSIHILTLVFYSSGVNGSIGQYHRGIASSVFDNVSVESVESPDLGPTMTFDLENLFLRTKKKKGRGSTRPKNGGGRGGRGGSKSSSRKKSSSSEDNASNDGNMPSSSPSDKNDSVDTCALGADSLLAADEVLRTSVDEIDQYLDQEGRAVGNLRDIISQVRSTIPSEEFPNISDRDILEAMMIKQVDFSINTEVRNLQLSTNAGDSELLSGKCITAILALIPPLVSLVLVALVPGLITVASAIGRAVARLIRQSSKIGNALFEWIYFIMIRSETILDGAFITFVGIVNDITVAAFMDIVNEEVDWVQWISLGATVLIELIALVASFGTYAAIAPAVRAAGAALIGVFELSTAMADVYTCMDEESPSPTINVFSDDDPTRTPTIAPSRPQGFQSGVFGDPHLSTFDTLRFDCQAQGIFTMLTSLQDSSFVIQEKFTGVGSDVCSQASVSTGIAIEEIGFPTIQLSVPRGNNLSQADFLPNGCPIDLYVDGRQEALLDGFVSDAADVEVLASPSDLRVVYHSTGLVIDVEVRVSDSFGCFFLVQIFLPAAYRSGETLLGLLGKPNGVRDDDWVDRNGNSYAPPANQEQSVFGDAYNYCVENWCVQNEAGSIFTFRPDESFDNANRCGESYADEIEMAITNASPALQSICQDDLFCYVDGVCGNLNDATAAIEDEETVMEAQRNVRPPVCSDLLDNYLNCIVNNSDCTTDPISSQNCQPCEEIMMEYNTCLMENGIPAPPPPPAPTPCLDDYTDCVNQCSNNCASCSEALTEYYQCIGLNVSAFTEQPTPPPGSCPGGSLSACQTQCLTTSCFTN